MTHRREIQQHRESIIEIQGVDELKPMNYAIIPDRIEAGTFMTIAGITGSDIILKECRVEDLDALIMKLRETGIVFENSEKGLRVTGSEKLKSTNITTMPYPGFPRI